MTGFKRIVEVWRGGGVVDCRILQVYVCFLLRADDTMPLGSAESAPGLEVLALRTRTLKRCHLRVVMGSDLSCAVC